MFSYHANWKVVTLLSWDILKLRTQRLLRKFFAAGEKHQSTPSNSRGREEARVTVLARKANPGYYEVILPFAGKLLIDEHTFEMSYEPVEPARANSDWGIDSGILKTVYQKYVCSCAVALR